MKSSIEFIRLMAVLLIVFTHTRHELEAGPAYFVVEKIPTFGTALLSIISGFLYFEVSRNKPNLFFKKIKSLALPYLMANGVVLALVLLAYVLGYNALNRLHFDHTLITEGLFALHTAPINPPTYFIRDIFIIFSILALFTQRSYASLGVLIPYLLLGTLILRMDVAFLFIMGMVYAQYRNHVDKKLWLTGSILLTLVFGLFFSAYLKFPLALLVFILMLDLRMPLYRTGRFSYLLHLYHSPIIVISYPMISSYLENPLLRITAQIVIAVFFVYLLFLMTRRYPALKVLSGGR